MAKVKIFSVGAQVVEWLGRMPRTQRADPGLNPDQRIFAACQPPPHFQKYLSTV